MRYKVCVSLDSLLSTTPPYMPLRLTSGDLVAVELADAVWHPRESTIELTLDVLNQGHAADGPDE